MPRFNKARASPCASSLDPERPLRLSGLSPLITMTRHIQDDIPLCMFFACDIVIVYGTAKHVNAKLDQRETL